MHETRLAAQPLRENIMRYALLLAAVPKSFVRGAITRIPNGTWTIHIHGINDSVLAMDVNGSRQDVQHGTELRLSKPSIVQMAFARRGSESDISVFAESIS